MQQHYFCLFNYKIKINISLVALAFVLFIITSPIFAYDCGETVPDGDHPLNGYFANHGGFPYEKSEDGKTVTASNGLMWQSEAPINKYYWDSACYYCDSLRLGNYKDWRLPRVNELESIIDEDSTPTISASFFTAQEGLYWSCSVPKSYDTNAWIVSFIDGHTTITDKTGTMYVRCVRDVSDSGVQGNSLSIEWEATLYRVAPFLKTTTNLNTAATSGYALIPQITTGENIFRTDTIDFGVTSISRKDRDGNDVIISDITEGSSIDYRWTISGIEETDHLISNANKIKQKITIDNDGGSTGSDIKPGDYTLTVEVWDHEYPQNYAKESVNITICDGDCTLEHGDLQNIPLFVNEDHSLSLKKLLYQDRKDDPKVKLSFENLRLKLIDDPVGHNRVLFELETSVSGEDVDQNYTIPDPPPPITLTNSLGMTFNLMPAGTFMMGSPGDEGGRISNETQHEVTLTQPFYMQTTEVTQGQWKAVMGNNPSWFSGCGDNCPVEMVSWDDVQGFIATLNALGEGVYALPTEAQWEYAARAGTTTAFANGDITASGFSCDPDPNLDIMGWHCGNSDKTHPVVQKKANNGGLYDMHGNLYEWCQDWFDNYPSESVIDPVGASSGSIRVIRGGSWSNNARNCRSAYRNLNYPGRRRHLIGFRLVLSPGQQ
ncbi:exported hypothetical protein [Desulfamplus magnetovallimortis]|uniref:Uncharacterized protein n=1 Tax=Desulfamplus magnetovallimortis TaxID=1246637 RepID=A0A1W1HBJ2_9BACT|nr:SUMF1/EgtB/PvdO family nonheme iron enzyme [Desulfamplus magnetovallimortis]SLM29857.1 exported hypothetical protein [Desulfamplus magnetovallimortis]